MIEQNEKNCGLRKGRLSLEERRHIAEQYDRKTPIEIARELNRTVEPIFTYLDKNIPDWRSSSPYFSWSDKATTEKTSDQTKDFHKKILELSKTANISYVEAKRSLRKDENSGAKTIEDLDKLVDSLKAQRSYVNSVTEEISNNIDYWKKAAIDWASAELSDKRRDIEIQRARLQSDIVTKMNMPSPPAPTMTAEGFLKTDKEFSGIYFAWSEGKVVYVGKSNNILKRIKKHKSSGKVRSEMPLSWLEFPMHQLYTTECFYIWLLCPELNGEAILDSHYIQDEHESFTEEIHRKLDK